MNNRIAAGVLACCLGVVSFVAWRVASSPSRSGEASGAGGAITLTDLAGKTVRLPKSVRRIVLMRSFYLHELALVLGDEIGDKLVGWDASLPTSDRQAYLKFTERYPRMAEIAVLGDSLRGTVNAEAVVALRPDLVIMDVFMIERAAKLVERLEQAGAPLLFVDCGRDPLRSPQASLRLLGRALGKERRAEAVAGHIDAEVDRVLARVAKLEGQGPSIYLEAAGGVRTYGNTYGHDERRKSSGWGSLMAQLRCRNIAEGSVGSMGKINPEYLLKADPDVIVLAGAHWTEIPDSLQLGYYSDVAGAKEQLAAFEARPGWAGLKAVQDHRLYGLHMRFCTHATGFVAAQQLAKWLHPDAFRDLDPVRSQREFYEKFMPVGLSGTWMVDLGDR